MAADRAHLRLATDFAAQPQHVKGIARHHGIRGPVAWTTYRNEAVLQMPQERIDLLWYETAVLEQVDGEWRISRLQSTPVRPR